MSTLAMTLGGTLLMMGYLSYRVMPLIERDARRLGLFQDRADRQEPADEQQAEQVGVNNN